MGKSNRKGKAKDRTNPISKPVKPPSDPELAALREKKILPIVSDLQNPDPTKRSSAATAIANIIEDTKIRKLLLREQVVRILLEQTVTDSSLESKSAGWGILKNLALEEEPDFCVHLFRQDILTPIQAVIQTIVETIESREPPVTKLPKAQQTLLWSLSSSIVGLISSLAEAQEDIVEAISKLPTVLEFLFGLLGSDAVPTDLFNDVLSCLATLTEDNPILSKKIVDHEGWLKGLMQLREHGGARAVTACGVLHNTFVTMRWFDHNTPMAGASDAMLVPTLVHCIAQVQSHNGQLNGSGDSSPDQVLQLALETLASIATGLQEALEHASKHEKEFEGFGDDTSPIDEPMDEDTNVDGEGDADAPSDGEEEEENLVDDEMTQDEIDADMRLVAGFDANDEEDSSEEQPTLDALIRTAAPVVLAVVSSANHEAIRTSALAALNNIAWTISSIDFKASSSSLRKLWAPTAQQVWAEAVSPVLASNTADISLASSVTSLAWALARSVQGEVQIATDEQRKFMALYQASKGLGKDGKANDEDAFQGLGVKCIGVLGRLALDPAPVELNREIGVFLLTVLAAIPDTPAADAVEALDQLFDIYADNSFACDEIFWSNGFYKHLEEVSRKVKAMAKSIDKRKETELRGRADEAVLNLQRFLKYKRTEKANIS